MQKSLLIILLCISNYYSYTQQFSKSNTFSLTKVDNKRFNSLMDADKDFDGYMPIYVVDKYQKRIRKIKVFAETYDTPSLVFEMTINSLKNVTKVTQVEISECAAYCDDSVHTWLVTEEGKWIDLPIIENRELEVSGLKKKQYTFDYPEVGDISLVEIQFKILKGKQKSLLKKESQNVLKTLK